MSFDPILRYQNLLIAMCREVRNREVYAAGLLLAPGYAQNKTRAHEINKSANRLRFMLGRNHRAMSYFFRTCDPDEIQSLETRKDEVSPAAVGNLAKAKDRVDSALWCPSVTAKGLFHSILIGLRRLAKEGYSVTCVAPGSDQKFDLDPETMIMQMPLLEEGTASENPPDEEDEQREETAA